MGRSFLALLACLPLSACFVMRWSENEPLSPPAVHELVPGRTTAREVVEKLGAPSEVVQLGRRSAYRYDHMLQKGAGFTLLVVTLANIDQRADRTWVFFDEEQVVSHVGSTFASHHTQYSMPWENIHEAEDNESRDADRPGLGTR